MKIQMAVLLWCGLVAGCGATRPAFIHPDVMVSASDIGKGRKVSLSAADMRGDKKLGDAEVAAPDYDLAANLASRLGDGLSRQGFAVLPGADLPALRLELLELKYDTSQSSLVKGVLSTRAVIKVTLRYPGGSYENIYRGNNEERDLLSPSANDIERLLNNNLSEILQKIADNPEIRKALTANGG